MPTGKYKKYEHIVDIAEKSPSGEFGGGFVNPSGRVRGLQVKLPPITQMPVADPQAALDELSKAEGSNQWQGRKHPLKPRQTRLVNSGSVTRKGRCTKLQVMGIPSHVLDAGSPEYARCVKLARSFMEARKKEIFEAHGYVSAGTAALLAAAALALSASRFLYEIAASTPIRPGGDDRGLSMPQILKLASSLGDSYRQNELSAWELAAREGVVRRRNEANNQSLPWIQPSIPELTGGRRGRPRKVEMLESNLLQQGDSDAGYGQVLLGEAEGSGA